MRKRGQEEIVGFVLIIVLVMVVIMVFLGISLRKGGDSQRESQEVYQFLESSMEQTTECALSEGRSLLKLDELISECYSSNNECVNEEKTCNVLNETFTNILEASWKYGEDFQIKGYELGIVYSHNNSNQAGQREEILEIMGGSCEGSVFGNSYWTPEFPGSITTTLKLCY